MAEPTPSQDGLFDSEEEDILKETRTLRRKLIRLLSDGTKLPDDKSDKIMLTQLMNDLDGQVIAKARVKIAAKTEENSGNMTALVADILRKHRVGELAPVTERSIELPKDVSVGTIVPGEMDQGTTPVTMKDLGL